MHRRRNTILVHLLKCQQSHRCKKQLQNIRICIQVCKINAINASWRVNLWLFAMIRFRNHDMGNWIDEILWWNQKQHQCCFECDQSGYDPQKSTLDWWIQRIFHKHCTSPVRFLVFKWKLALWHTLHQVLRSLSNSALSPLEFSVHTNVFWP